MPVVTAAESDVNHPIGQMERAVCVYIRSIQDERVMGEVLCAHRAVAAAAASNPGERVSQPSTRRLLQRRVRQGGLAKTRSRRADSMEQYNHEAQAQQKKQIEYLQQLSNDNFQLRVACSATSLTRSRAVGCGSASSRTRATTSRTTSSQPRRLATRL